MADVALFAPKLLALEGGFVSDPDDPGGATNMGVTLGTWRDVGYDIDGDGDIDARDLRLITPEQVVATVLKPHYWDRWRADEISNQAIAELLVDWLYNSGSVAITAPQRILGVRADGIVGPVTLKAVNGAGQRELFDRVMHERRHYYEDLASRRPAMRKFLKGWLNRLSHFKFEE